MNQYYFLFGLAFVYVIFAVVVDLRKREVPNWLNFSLIAFAFGYRAFYSAFFEDVMFFVYGLVGFGVFFGLAYAFYYGRVFAGGDAKLLMGMGIILTYSNFKDILYNGGQFILALFLLGATYSLVYSFFIAYQSKGKFSREFGKKFKKEWKIFGVIVLISAVFLFFDINLGGLIFVFCLLSALLYFYAKAVDRCMIRKIKAGELSEGDWLERDIKVGRRLIKKSMHGLNWEEIKILRKANKDVLIKEGIPFTPAFLLALLYLGYSSF